MSDPNIKQLTVTGNAAESFLNKNSRRKRKTSANKTLRQEGKEQQGGSSGTVVQVQANKAPDAPALDDNALSQAKASNASALAKVTTNSASASVTQMGGKKPVTPNVKVVLAQGKKGAKVILSPAKVKKLPGAAPSEKAKTRKAAKKIRMSLHGLGKRVTRANNIRKDASKQPIADVKKTLVTAKLIKEGSKAPEDILRKMYSDYMMLKNRAL